MFYLTHLPSSQSSLACRSPSPHHCPGQKPPFLAVKRPARPYKTATQNRFTMGNTNGAYTPRAGPDRVEEVLAERVRAPAVPTDRRARLTAQQRLQRQGEQVPGVRGRPLAGPQRRRLRPWPAESSACPLLLLVFAWSITSETCIYAGAWLICPAAGAWLSRHDSCGSGARV